MKNTPTSYVHLEKLKEWGRGIFSKRMWRHGSYYWRNWGVQGCWEHDIRLVPIPEINPNRSNKTYLISSETGWNPVEIGSEIAAKTGVLEGDFISRKAQKFLEDRGIKTRNDQVLVSYMTLSVGQRYFESEVNVGEINEELAQKWAAASFDFLPEPLPPQ